MVRQRVSGSIPDVGSPPSYRNLASKPVWDLPVVVRFCQHREGDETLLKEPNMALCPRRRSDKLDTGGAL
jgi:hypothetical protein